MVLYLSHGGDSAMSISRLLGNQYAERWPEGISPTSRRAVTLEGCIDEQLAWNILERKVDPNLPGTASTYLFCKYEGELRDYRGGVGDLQYISLTRLEISAVLPPPRKGEPGVFHHTASSGWSGLVRGWDFVRRAIIYGPPGHLAMLDWLTEQTDAARASLLGGVA
jgi:hypothetical protein